MKQLTRKEILELGREAIYNADDNDINDGRERERVQMESVLQVLQKAGVLMLLSEDEKPIEGDFVAGDNDVGGYEGERYFDLEGMTFECFQKGKKAMYKVRVDEIIQRANTPVYQCKKEQNNEKI